jgi:hypothetical protein
LCIIPALPARKKAAIGFPGEHPGVVFQCAVSKILRSRPGSLIQVNARVRGTRAGRMGGGDESNKVARCISDVRSLGAREPRDTPTPEDAGNHVGQNAAVRGVVAITNFDADTEIWPTFLDFGRPYPDQVFSADP